jgi:VWFA-related protein
MAIFALHKNLRLIRGFTTDFSGIEAALDDKNIGARPEVSPLLPTFSKQADENEILRAMVRNMSSPVKVDAVRDYQADRAAELNTDRSDLTFQALQALAGFLSGMPARKNLVWFADSFPVSFLPDGRVRATKHQELLQQTSDLLTAGQIAIYPVSAWGVVGDASFEATDVRSRGDRQPTESEAVQIAMEDIAHDTGGRAFYSKNGLNEAFATAVNEGALRASLFATDIGTMATSAADTSSKARYRL